MRARGQMKKAMNLAGEAANSVIDYAIDSAHQIAVTTLNHYLSKYLLCKRQTGHP